MIEASPTFHSYKITLLHPGHLFRLGLVLHLSLVPHRVLGPLCHLLQMHHLFLRPHLFRLALALLLRLYLHHLLQKLLLDLLLLRVRVLLANLEGRGHLPRLLVLAGLRVQLMAFSSFR
jgi:hypothetical protein